MATTSRSPLKKLTQTATTPPAVTSTPVQAEVTDWYTRTDEDGNPVDYDYERGEYITASEQSPDGQP
jgi:flagellar basal body rod protein FlgB